MIFSSAVPALAAKLAISHEAAIATEAATAVAKK
jgi:hypothetical protein